VEHAIRDVRTGDGSLEFEAEIAGRSRGLWLHTAERVPPRPDAVVPATVLLAMVTGGTLRVPGTVSPRMLAGVEGIQAILAGWSRGWPLTDVPLRRVEVVADRRAEAPHVPGRRVAAFFSGGVDSFATVLARPEVTDLIFVAGLDVPLSDPARLDRVEAHLREAAAELGRRLIRVDTNLRQLADPILNWQVYYGSALAAVAVMLSGAYRRIHLSGYDSYANVLPSGVHPLIDHLWAPDGLEIFHDGATMDRAERVARLAHDPVARRRLRVCWQNVGAELNCGVCHKCMVTMVPLAALGVLERFETFPGLDLDRLVAMDIADPLVGALWEANRDLATRERAPAELRSAIDAVLDGLGRRPPPRRRWRR
jgi:hypothetical protein